MVAANLAAALVAIFFGMTLGLGRAAHTAAALAADVPVLVAPDADPPAPVAAGESAASIALSGASRWVLLRWVARASGTLAALHLRIQADGSSCRRSGRTGYGAGDGGSWHVTTHPVLPDGRPALDETLATQDLRPCSSPRAVVDVREGIVRLPMAVAVVRGQEYATVIHNSDRAPTRNFTSTNWLYTSTGILGANGRNARSGADADSFYGLDPRELVGYSSDGGRNWALPGGPYGRPGGRDFLPTYLQEYADGRIAGQPYYYTPAPPATTPRTMVFGGVVSPWAIRALGAFTPRAGTGTLTLAVDGVVRTRVTVSGRGMLRAAIPPTIVLPGQTVTVTATGLAIQSVAADTAWARLVGMHLPTAPWHIQGERNFSRAAPVYALPGCGASCTDPYGAAVGPGPR